jgi:hypothetical protein
MNFIKSRTIRLLGHVTCMREIINAYKYFVGKPEETRPVGELDFKK